MLAGWLLRGASPIKREVSVYGLTKWEILISAGLMEPGKLIATD